MNQYIEVVPNLCRIQGKLAINEDFPWMARVMVPQSLRGTSGVYVEGSTGAAFVSAVASTPSGAVEQLERQAGGAILRAITERQLKEVVELEAQKVEAKEVSELRKAIRTEFVRMVESLAGEE